MVYVDLLVIEDLILNYCVVLGAGLILSRVTNLKKVFLSSVIGLFPLIFIFIPIQKFLLNILTLFFLILMSFISFGYRDIMYTIKNVIYMYFISIFLAGSIYLINTNFIPNVSSHLLKFLSLIIISPLITIVYIKSIRKIKISYNNYYKLDIYLKDKPKITVNSYLDTGNILKDPYSHKPIILINRKVIDYEVDKFIFVPYSTIDNQGLLKCFKPEKIYIHTIGFRQKLLIGLIDEVGIDGADCILNKELLERN